jgi:hypothetical protein
LRKYNGEPIETILIKTNVNPTRQKLEGRGREIQDGRTLATEGARGVGGLGTPANHKESIA